MRASVTKKRILCTIGGVLGAVLLVVVAYVLYVVLRYYRVEDNVPLPVAGEAQAAVPVGEELSLLTYNIGFGAYGPDYSFFMDGGEHSRALSEQAVLTNTDGALGVIRAESPSFVLLQEVDVDGTRSYHIDQSARLADGLGGYDRLFAQNYDSPYLFYPFNKPIGANKSGLMTFSQYNITAAHRRRLPVETSFYKFLDLDRAYAVSVIPTENGKDLVLYNVHLSAYTSDGVIADEQLEMLCEDMLAQYRRGNYVVAAGDFNKDLLGDSSRYFERAQGDFTWAKPLDSTRLPSSITVHTGKNAPTCRNADAAYRGDGTDFVLSVDGALVSDNVTVLSSETVDTDFSYSDHDPVRVRFQLKE